MFIVCEYTYVCTYETLSADAVREPSESVVGNEKRVAGAAIYKSFRASFAVARRGLCVCEC